MVCEDGGGQVIFECLRFGDVIYSFIALEIQNSEKGLYSFPIIYMQRGQINSDLEGTVPGLYHSFLLKRISNEPNCPSVLVDFSPTTSPTPHDPTSQPTQLRTIHPTFNPDGCFFTPAFTLSVDKEKYMNNSMGYLTLHEAKREELSTQKVQLLVPKPSKVSSFCCICRTVFEDYLTHVTLPKHQELLRKSEFSNSISQLCRIFNSQEIEEMPKRGMKKHSRRIQKAQKPKKSRKEVDSACSSPLKLDSSPELKTKQTIV